eukprot:COSAG02_NODE_13960_length_1327_cov_0.772801_1_plen_27_part_10
MDQAALVREAERNREAIAAKYQQERGD